MEWKIDLEKPIKEQLDNQGLALLHEMEYEKYADIQQSLRVLHMADVLTIDEFNNILYRTHQKLAKEII